LTLRYLSCFLLITIEIFRPCNLSALKGDDHFSDKRLFGAIKEDGDIEPVFNKIVYKDLKNHWIPAMESAEQEGNFAG
jgi:hypothetical protein